MSKFRNRISSILNTNTESFFANNPRAFANYTLQVNLLEGGSVEGELRPAQLDYAFNEGNLLNNKLLLFKLFKKTNSSAN